MNSVDLISSHILNSLAGVSNRPLFVALQGPQGSGKSYLTALLHTRLSELPHSLRVATLSIDDLYLPHSSLISLAERNPHNPLWRGRGQPGTHDVQLGVKVLEALKDGREVEIPRFDKSLFNGEGDRLPMDGSGTIAKPPVDVVLMEGWCNGFFGISEAELDKRWNVEWQKVVRDLDLHEQHVGTKENISQINAKLHDYISLWSFFDVFVQLVPAQAAGLPSPYSIVYRWRLEQEHNMKAKNGGKGMSDDAVKLFVDRYIPGYVFFGDGVTKGYIDGVAISDSPDSSYQIAPRWLGHGLRLCIDERREVVNVETF